MNNQNNIIANIRKWHPLTEIPAGTDTADVTNSASIPSKDSDNRTIQKPLHPSLEGASEALFKLLWDILRYPYSSISVRIKRLCLSARAFENAKREGCEKQLFIESSAGLTIFLIGTPKTFEIFNKPCPYNNDKFIEHGFYVGLGSFLLEKSPQYKKVYRNYPIGSSNRIADLATLCHSGLKEAYEVTLSTTNILSNAAKYQSTNFVKIVFLCRNYRLREAVKACCREGGLNPDLLAKLEYVHFSQLLQRQRKLSLY